MFSVWDGFSKEQKEEFCRAYLVERGYHVWGPILHKNNVKTIPQLVQFFYDVMASRRQNHTIMYALPNKTIDRAVMNNLVKSRMKLGMSKQRAIDEVCMFIETLFEYEDRILLEQVSSPRILTNEKMAWLSERIWKICEGIDIEISMEKEQLWFDKVYEEQAVTSDEDVEKALEKMNKIREGETKDG